jgi:hypothetical protein
VAVELLGSARNSTSGLIFASFAVKRIPRRRMEGATMDDGLSFLTGIDRLCGQFATALHNAEWQVYATLTILIVLSTLLFPPKDDPDQI